MQKLPSAPEPDVVHIDDLTTMPSASVSTIWTTLPLGVVPAGTYAPLLICTPTRNFAAPKSPIAGVAAFRTAGAAVGVEDVVDAVDAVGVSDGDDDVDEPAPEPLALGVTEGLAADELGAVLDAGATDELGAALDAGATDELGAALEDGAVAEGAAELEPVSGSAGADVADGEVGSP